MTTMLQGFILDYSRYCYTVVDCSWIFSIYIDITQTGTIEILTNSRKYRIQCNEFQNSLEVRTHIYDMYVCIHMCVQI